jgi:phage tail sheath protein FI
VGSASVVVGANSQKSCYFGVDLQETAGSKRHSSDIVDLTRILPAGLETAQSADYQYVFTLDNVVMNGTGSNPGWAYSSGSRANGQSYTATSGASDLVNNKEINKFTTVLYGGFDGLDITELDPFRNNILAGDTATVDTTKYGQTEATNYALHSVNRALNIIRDTEDADYNLLAMPALTNEGLTDELIDICEDRGDSLAVIDIQNDYQPRAEGSSATYPKLPNLTNAVNTWRERSTDSSYGCAFFPWVQTRDRRSGQLIWIPPSVAALGTMGSSAARSELWFAPAGFNRGGLSQGAAGIPVVNVRKKLTSKDRDKLYENRINPIASFPAEGIVIFGQKTCQVATTALDRINVRRLLIFLKKQISTIANTILFDQNVPATWARFKGQVDPLLNDVKTRFGLSDYRLILDETTTTPDLIDRNVMYAKVFLKPARAIEYIALDFFISSTGASFED